VDFLVSGFAWIGAHEAVLSGIAATIVIVGVLFTPLGRGVRALIRRRRGDEPTAKAGGLPGLPVVSDRPSIAVLPFANLSNDPEREYLADGLTEDIITGLSRIKQFFVIARNSTFTYKGMAVDVQQVSRELGVRYVLEGSVRLRGDRIRVTAQLIDATTRGHAWAEQFDRPLREILDVDDEVTEAIVAALQPALRRAEAEHARRAAPGDLNAWALVNRAWVGVQSDLGSRETAESAIQACEEALRLDPDYALAHAVLGHARSLIDVFGADPAAAEAALASVRKGLALGPDDPLVHHCQAAVFGNLGRTPDAVRAWERALELDPNSAAARAGLGIAQVFSNRHDEALANIDLALRLSPRDPLTYHWLAHRALVFAAQARRAEALETAQDSVQRNGSRIGYAVLAGGLAWADRLEEAKAAYAEFARRTPDLDSEDLLKLLRNVAPDETSARAMHEAIMRAAGD